MEEKEEIQKSIIFNLIKKLITNLAGIKACKVHETFFHKAGAVAQMVEQQNYFSLQANEVPMNSNCVSQVRALSAPQNKKIRQRKFL